MKNEKLNLLIKKIENLEEEKKNVIELIKAELLAYTKEQYEGKVIQTGNESIKIRKVISVEPIHFGEKCFTMNVSGIILRTTIWLNNTIEVNDSCSTKYGGVSITINLNGSLSYSKLVDDNNFDKRYKAAQKMFKEYYRDATGFLIKNNFSKVHYIENGKIRMGVVHGFDLDKKEFILYDYDNDGSDIYKKGSEIYLII